MAIVLDLITRALMEIGAYSAGGGPGETPTAEDAQLAFSYFQMQLDAWNAERETLIVQARIDFILKAGTSYVTIGPGGDIPAPRPTWLDTVRYVIPGSAPEVEVSLGLLDDQSYADITIKELPNTLPLQCYYQTGPVTGTLFFWPRVTQDIKIYLYYLASEDIPVALTSVVNGPPGYLEAFHYQLAERLLTPFSVANPVVISLVRDHSEKAYARMKRPNMDPGQRGIDLALTGAGAYNVLADTFGGSR
jgi:hypothetical protein